MANICPLFYVETLADLEKSVREGRSPEKEVAIIADKFPEMHGSPNAHHVNLCIENLLGNKVPMTGQIPLSGGRLVKSGGKTGVVYEQSPESEAFSRWQKGDFLEIERRYARAWRESLSTLDLQEVTKGFRSLGIDGKSCKSLKDAKSLSEEIVYRRDKPFDLMKLAILFLHVPVHLHHRILERWSITNYQPLIEYAPYVSHVLEVEIFFQISLAANLIASERPSNRMDIGYLFYLPFCKIFVSSDKLHQRCAHLFLRRDQNFVWGVDLKEDLGKLNDYYMQLPAREKERGIISFSFEPPREGDFLVSHFWDQYFPKWRERKQVEALNKQSDNSELVKELTMMANAPELQMHEIDFNPTETDALTIQRNVRRMKGSWYQVPKDLKIDKKK